MLIQKQKTAEWKVGQQKKISEVCKPARIGGFVGGFTEGFTLIESIVSIAIFMVVMAVSVTALLSIISANKESHAIKTVMDNLNFALDDMSRSIRVGTNYSCGTQSSPSAGHINCSLYSDTNTQSFSYTSQYDNFDYITYTLINGAIYKVDETSGAQYELTDPQINVTDMRFYLAGAVVGASDGQPHVVITMTGTASNGNQKATFSIQTSVTQLQYDQ
jgi:type II secretory pathway pseudopilin PulG